MPLQPNHQIVDTSLDNVLVIIPVRNEAETITTVIKDLQSFGLTKIRVVDNGSSDRSGEVAQQAGAEVFLESIPGYGQACWRGLQNIPADIDWILFCDGDGSDSLSCLSQFFDLRQRYDLILGNRLATSQGKEVMTAAQRFGNSLASWLINWGWGHQYHDLGPLRLINRLALEQIAMQDRGFGWTVEMQVRAIEEKLNICEIPVSYRPRQGGRSKISGTISGSIRAGIIILSTLGSLYFFAQGSRPSKKSQPHLTDPTLDQQKSTKENSLAKICLWLSVFCLIIGALLTLPYGDFRQPANVIGFGYGIAVMSLGFILSWQIKTVNIAWFWSVAIATRLILLFMYPGDDIWRYLWEGYIQNLGFSPYDFAPNAPELIPYRTDWWSQINHPRVSAIYPPLTQLGFRGLAAIAPSVVLFKSSFAIADLLTCWLLTTRFSYAQVTFYAWNPLVIYSFAGGGHYDSWFVLPLVAAWLWWDRQKIAAAKTGNRTNFFASLLIGISIAVKWISLPILGFLSWVAWRKLNFRAAALITICGVVPILITALAFCNADSCYLIPTGSTFVNNGRSAEFLPHLLAKVWQTSIKSNGIFALPLGLATLVLIWRSQNFQQFTLGFFAALLTISPIVHAWYFTWIIPFAVVTKNWGVRLVSLSVFVYFVLPYRQALGNRDWNLTDLETWLLWLPFVVGYGWSLWRGFSNKQS